MLAIRLRAISLVLVSFSLVGCTTLAPMQLSVVDGRLSVAFCQSSAFSEFEVLQSRGEKDADEEWVVVASADKPFEVEANDVLTVGTSGALLDGPSEVQLNTSADLSVEFERDGAGFDNPLFPLPSDGLQEGVWLRSDGSTASMPCG